MKRARVVAWGIWLLSAAVTASGLALTALTPPERVPTGMQIEETTPFLLMQLPFMTVGALVGARRPDNPIGLLLAGLGLVSALQYLTAGYAVFGAFAALPRAELSAWLFTWSGAMLGVLASVVVLLFPDGRFRPRGRHGAVAAALGGTAIVLYLAFRPGPLASLPSIENPYAQAWPSSVFDTLLVAGVASFLASAAAAVDSLRQRMQRSSGVERQQLKWFLGGALLSWVALVVTFPVVFVNWPLARYLFAFSLAGLPITIGIAILRYRLYDIDVLINRTLVYATLSAVLAGTYVVSVLALTALLRPLTGSSDLAVAGSTLAVVALFSPLRRRIQAAVDRRFYRSRYDAARTLDAFGARLRDEVDLDSVRADLLDVVHDTVRPAHASVWLRERAR